MNNPTNFVERLKALRTKLKLTQAEFAPIIHLDRSYLSQLESGKREIMPWLQERINVLEKEQDIVERVNTPNATAPVPTEKILPHRVPVVSWAKAGCGGNFHDLANQIDEWLDTDCKDPNSYALIIDGDSMEPQFFTGDRVVFLPNSQAQNGDIVVARLKETGDVFFKLFHQTGRNLEVVRLTSYNPAYPPLEHLMHEFRFIHPMYCLVRKRRRL